MKINKDIYEKKVKSEQKKETKFKSMDGKEYKTDLERARADKRFLEKHLGYNSPKRKR